MFIITDQQEGSLHCRNKACRPDESQSDSSMPYQKHSGNSVSANEKATIAVAFSISNSNRSDVRNWWQKRSSPAHCGHLFH
ncbi:hypothetical protein [Herbaspirillum aquaticum]|uniref:hypothetical protein n=1 Tax=Herbaspirillum aquaticum TaxID=568783 RepID=UPI0024DE972B|nr:hypothetical protein [Herbaspirillum aquaticum]